MSTARTSPWLIASRALALASLAVLVVSCATAGVLLQDHRAEDVHGTAAIVLTGPAKHFLGASDVVLAIGNPFGLGQTVTMGIVSALGRSGINAEGYEDFIQTDASINPGNSGGALVSLSGELIGINTAIIAPSGGNVGIGFAVSSNMARSVMDQLIRYGEVQRGRLGFVVQDITPDIAKAIGVPATAEGAVVVQVEPGSAADKAGVKAGDVVTALGGRPVRGASSWSTRAGAVPGWARA